MSKLFDTFSIHASFVPDDVSELEVPLVKVTRLDEEGNEPVYVYYLASDSGMTPLTDLTNIGGLTGSVEDRPSLVGRSTTQQLNLLQEIRDNTGANTPIDYTTLLSNILAELEVIDTNTTNQEVQLQAIIDKPDPVTTDYTTILTEIRNFTEQTDLNTDALSSQLTAIEVLLSDKTNTITFAQVTTTASFGTGLRGLGFTLLGGGVDGTDGSGTIDGLPALVGTSDNTLLPKGDTLGNDVTLTATGGAYWLVKLIA